ncbi:2-(3-amino-3-carboxypropyl)histidine synthase subunit 1 [Neocloeon triangulifer]|uniref:2-(3-amino-3-carboxypropyl)histidine synthase subunit 1 n=1 Tax=Neocloeon triangulifer TaxID=2078957 RepID=UPI00286F07FA|nr:2-(3-amino-3-carboxypropyl)histidine synthase subunit 1 [Neocloeon triangulifer]XP_059479950.1 2-(3-amino-3-carboxypropyl)histidine synthase subunit 1 [Neocloeon triangulifer]
MSADLQETSQSAVVVANPARKVIKPAVTRVNNKIPDEIIQDHMLNAAIKVLPPNYNFEVHKTIWRIKQLDAKIVGLQLPEGLLLFATTLADIIEQFTECEEVVIMGDVTYGACCVDDITAKSLGVELLIHYGHSCLVPIDRTASIKVLYIFVDIKIDILHFIESVKLNFTIEKTLAFVSTVQFIASLHGAASELRKCGFNIIIPQSKPLSAGEILGCTSPNLETNVDAIIYLGDGRFHLESAMISNPTVPAYKFDPYDKKFTLEEYDHEMMLSFRKESVDKSIKAGTFGLILGTLGRQGNPTVLSNLEKSITKSNLESVVVLLSEIFPQKLALFGPSIDAWVQVACPRLSIDWGRAFQKPLLTPFELNMTLRRDNTLTKDGHYPMDYYANDSRGDWTPNHRHAQCDCDAAERC